MNGRIEMQADLAGQSGSSGKSRRSRRSRRSPRSWSSRLALLDVMHRDAWRAVSTPGPWLILAITAASAILVVRGITLAGAQPSQPMVHLAVPLLAGLLGSMTVGADLRYGTWHLEVLLAGSRTAHWLRATASVLALGLLVGATSGLASWGCCALWADDSLGSVDAARRAAGAVMLAAAAWAILGASVTAIFGSQIAGTSGVVVYVMVEPLIEPTLGMQATWLPGKAFSELLAASADGLADDARSLAFRVLLVAAALWVGAWLTAARRPIPVVAT